ncbi:MAG: hypothetical protein M1830_010380 [Pleopsidium flavum]|nr:MAG: hypothetical protein M1830_010380 [Pleopsidium flavum]
MEMVLRYLLFPLCWATSTIAAPTDNNSNNVAITGSSDAWASLVANVVPLLILVGEKHVKAYFKCLSQRSQLALYAVSPIGLVTAMVTMVRLGNSPLMKRLIGRQFESRAEVLADVTSVSGGNVGFELRGPRSILEQTINPDPKDEARFWIQGRKIGTGREGIEFGAQVEALVNRASKSWIGVEVGSTVADSQSQPVNRAYPGGIDNEGWMTGVISNESRNCQGTVLIVFDASGKDARNVARSHTVDCSTLMKPLTAGPVDSCCNSRSLAYVSWPDVSQPLTTNANVNHKRMRIFQNTAALICLLINVALTILNWVVTHNKLTTSLISLGLTGSTMSSFWTAVLVSRGTSQETVSTEGIHPFRAGFWSSNYPWGVRLNYSPRQVVMSVERDKTSQHFSLEIHDLVTPASVFVTASAFILLYLGLRAAEWWVPFAMLGNVAFATCMRATLTVNSPLLSSDWYKPSGATWSPNPFSHSDHLWLLHLWRDLQPEAEESSSSKSQEKRTHSSLEREAVSPVSGSTMLRRGLPIKFGPRFLRYDTPTLSSNKLSWTNPTLQQDSRGKLTDAFTGSRDCWTVLSVCRKRAGSQPTPVTKGLQTNRLGPHSQLVHAGIAVANEIARRKLVTSESRSCHRSRQAASTEVSAHPEIEYIRSEFISRDGIWQQPLEIAVSKTQDNFWDPEAAVDTSLRAWAVVALLGGKGLSKVQSLNLIPYINCKEDPRHAFVLLFKVTMASTNEMAMVDFWNHEERNNHHSFDPNNLDSATALQLTNAFWSSPWMLWMAVKVIFALFGEEAAQLAKLQPTKLYDQDPRFQDLVPEDQEKLRQDWIPGYVDFLETAELLLPREARSSATNTAQGGRAPIKDNTTSTDRSVPGTCRCRSSCSPESSKLCNTSGELAGVPHHAGYMSLG